MRKNLLCLLVGVLFISCSKDNEKPIEQEIWLSGYTALTNTSTYEKASTLFLFFKADNGEEFDTNTELFDGTISEYQMIKDEVFELLEKDHKIKLKSGEIISAYDSKFVSVLKDTYTSTFLPVGKYYVVAIYQGAKDGYIWVYSNQYAGKYIDIKSSYNPPAFSVVFPYDLKKYGYITWVSSNEYFDYEFGPNI